MPDKLTEQDMIKLTRRPDVTSDLARQIANKSAEEFLRAAERGCRLICAYVGYEIRDSFRILAHEVVDGWKWRQPEEVMKSYEEGPSFSYNGIDYYLVNVRKHLYYATETR